MADDMAQVWESYQCRRGRSDCAARGVEAVFDLVQALIDERAKLILLSMYVIDGHKMDFANWTDWNDCTEKRFYRREALKQFKISLLDGRQSKILRNSERKRDG